MKEVITYVVVGGPAQLGTRTSAGTVITKLRVNAYIIDLVQYCQRSPVR